MEVLTCTNDQKYQIMSIDRRTSVMKPNHFGGQSFMCITLKFVHRFSWFFHYDKIHTFHNLCIHDTLKKKRIIFIHGLFKIWPFLELTWFCAMSTASCYVIQLILLNNGGRNRLATGRLHSSHKKNSVNCFSVSDQYRTTNGIPCALPYL